MRCPDTSNCWIVLPGEHRRQALPSPKQWPGHPLSSKPLNIFLKGGIMCLVPEGKTFYERRSKDDGMD